MRSEQQQRGTTGPGRADRWAAWWTVLRLELWQEWYGVAGSTGRAVRRELAANLLETADEPGGVRTAARGLSTRELAREAAVDTGSPRWARGASAAALALGAVLLVQLVLSLVYVDGLLSAGGGQGELLGNEVSATDGAALTVTTTFGGWSLLLVPLVFVLVAKPWRLARRRVAAGA